MTEHASLDANEAQAPTRDPRPRAARPAERRGVASRLADTPGTGIGQSARPGHHNEPIRAQASFQAFRTGGATAHGATAHPVGTRWQAVAQSAQILGEAFPLDGACIVAEPAAGRDTSIELFYDSIADRFDRIMNSYDLKRRIETVFDVLLGRYDLAGRTLLDAGCGTGPFSLRACQRGADVTALDIGPRLLAQVRRKCNARTVLGNVLDLQFEDGTFDVVVSSECIEHTRNPQRAVHELTRVCRPGGLIVITSDNRFWYWLCDLANRFHWRPYEGIEDWPTWSQLRDWVEQAGARIIEMRGIHLFPFHVSLFHPILRFLDRFGRLLGPLCVNQAVLATKQQVGLSAED
ncbi:MAG: methyltransferase domain-containing protein [Phycisphaerae bacterium]|nr:methyltransferase domain-containing protein [Phycisphaerae bacterium]